MKIALIAVTVVLAISIATVAAIGATGGFSTEPSPTATTTPTYSASPTQTLDDISWLAKAIMSEASIGTQEERVCVGWTVLNRLNLDDRGIGDYGNSVEEVVKRGYAYNQEPSLEITALAKDILEEKIRCNTLGVTHFFSPISMPKEGDSTEGFDVGGGLHDVPGIDKKVYFPSWTETLSWAGCTPNIRRTHFMFYSDTGGYVYEPPDDWNSALVWMRDNTPGPFPDPNFYNEHPEMYEIYPLEGYDYPQTAYGVMSWWDYGKWITNIARRIPNVPSNHCNADDASNFLLAQDESSANEVLNELGSKYVIIDAETATQKFHAIPRWIGGSQEDFVERYYNPTTERYTTIYYPEYYRSMCARLYNFGGEAVTPQDSTYAILYTEKVDEEGNPYKEINKAANEGLPFATYDDAIAFINDHPDYILVGGLPFESPVPLEKLERYVLVHQSSPPTEWFGSTISYVKIFEYIP